MPSHDSAPSQPTTQTSDHDHDSASTCPQKCATSQTKARQAYDQICAGMNDDY